MNDELISLNIISNPHFFSFIADDFLFNIVFAVPITDYD